MITTVAGTGTPGFSGDGGDPLQAQFSFGYGGGIAFDAKDQLFIADTDNAVIRKITFGDHPVITTVAGTGAFGFSGDGGDPLQAWLYYPNAVTVDSKGNLYVADTENNRIRLITGVAAGKPEYANNITVSLATTQLTYPGATNVVITVTGSPTPTGTVGIYDGSAKLTTAYLQGDGKAYWYLQPGLGAGVHQISAVYSGDSRNAGGQSAPVAVNVDPVPVNFGAACWSAAPTTFQCTVSVSSNAGATLGSIQCKLDSNEPVSLPLSYGNAQFTLTPSAGSHTVSIQYPQQGNFAASQASTQSFTTK